ncbi:hypothetical protein VEV11M_43830 (plasmid) [Escherichia coli]|nr:hypothetical protein VEV11M_43830 [Escherichia coli]
MPRALIAISDIGEEAAATAPVAPVMPATIRPDGEENPKERRRSP